MVFRQTIHCCHKDYITKGSGELIVITIAVLTRMISYQNIANHKLLMESFPPSLVSFYHCTENHGSYFITHLVGALTVLLLFLFLIQS